MRKKKKYVYIAGIYLTDSFTNKCKIGITDDIHEEMMRLKYSWESYGISIKLFKAVLTNEYSSIFSKMLSLLDEISEKYEPQKEIPYKENIYTYKESTKLLLT